MYISFGKHSIQLHAYQSKDQMKDFLASCEAGSLVLGENPEQEMEFYVAEVYLDNSKLLRFGVGICSQGHGLVPNLLPLPEMSMLVFGFNSNVAAVRIPEGVIDFTLSLDTLFFSFVPLYDRETILVLHEIGVVSLTQQGKVVWKFNKDVVTNLTVKDDFLVLEFIDALPIRLKLSSGEVLQ